MSDAAESHRYEATALSQFAAALFERTGLAPDRARDVAEVLLEGDLLGHVTHGLGLAPLYLRSLRDGGMARTGQPEIVADHGASVTWDGGYLPGPWLVRRATSTALSRLDTHPVVTVVIRRSHHIGCLQAYLAEVVERGLVMLLMCSDPAHRSVAPFGAVEACFSPNPIAIGFPTESGPVLIDVSTASTAYGQVVRAAKAGKRMPGVWLVASDGSASDDPVPAIDGRGAVLQPLGGPDLGYKGFALGLLVETLTSALGGFGRADGETRWGASVFLQLIDPSRFGGREALRRETGFLAAACRRAGVAPGYPPVRMPGDRALAHRRTQIETGVMLPPATMSELISWAGLLAVPVPVSLS